MVASMLLFSVENDKRLDGTKLYFNDNNKSGELYELDLNDPDAPEVEKITFQIGTAIWRLFVNMVQPVVYDSATVLTDFVLKDANGTSCTQPLLDIDPFSSCQFRLLYSTQPSSRCC